jgi:hypothetical protein
MISSRRILWQALGVWLLLLVFAFVNALFRGFVLETAVGPEAAHVLATTTLAGAVFLASFLWVGTSPRRYSPRTLLAVGVGWAVLTLAFEFSWGRLVAGRPWSELLSEYDLSRGRLFGLVIAAELVSPLLVGGIRRLAGKTGPPA